MVAEPRYAARREGEDDTGRMQEGEQLRSPVPALNGGEASEALDSTS
jgi:hypothetical protein